MAEKLNQTPVAAGAIKLNIVKPAPSGSSKVVKPKKTEKVVYSDDSDDYDESSEPSSSSEDTDGFYVEMTLTCTNDDNDYADHNVVFNFGSESKYMEHAESGFEELDGIFEEAVATHFPSWTYANEWEESAVHGNEVPDDDSAVVVEVH